jgi:hypothetical protein
MSQTTATGLLTYAKDFRDAALAADDKLGKRPGFELVAPVPVMYLAAHSIELSLKAFLLHKGDTLEKLKSIGHDLKKAFKRAKSYGLPAALQATNSEVAALSALNALYVSKQLNYIQTGLKSYPVFGLVEALGKRLLLGVGEEIGYPPQYLV